MVKRPVSLLLLIVFAAVQLYFARAPLSHQVQGTSWIEVSQKPGGLVLRQDGYFLVTPRAAYRLRANQIHITAEPTSLTWVEVPEPSGSGVWKLAVGPESLPLLGIGGPVYPSPNGQSVIWVDHSTRLAYVSQSGQSGLHLLSGKLGALSQVVWAPDGQVVGVVGQGPEGEGAYVRDRDGNVDAMMVPSAGLSITSLGFSRTDTLLVSLNNGSVLEQGRGPLPLPQMSPLFLAHDHADILGETADHTIFWHDGERLTINRPDLKWEGRARFSRDGQRAAILSKTMGGAWKLLVYDGENGQQLEISLPFNGNADYRLLGFLGSHWVLVTVPSGEHAGTYAWWIQG
jgi:hypothetical protein